MSRTTGLWCQDPAIYFHVIRQPQFHHFAEHLALREARGIMKPVRRRNDRNLTFFNQIRSATQKRFIFSGPPTKDLSYFRPSQDVEAIGLRLKRISAAKEPYEAGRSWHFLVPSDWTGRVPCNVRSSESNYHFWNVVADGYLT